MTMAGGFFGLTLEKFLNLGLSSYASGMEGETLNKLMLVQDAFTPNFDTHDFRNDVTNEPGASGTYAAGGSVITATELTPAAPAATQIKYVSANTVWTGTTITARGTIVYIGRGGASSADELLFANTFGADAISAGGAYTVQVPTNGYFYVDYA